METGEHGNYRWLTGDYSLGDLLEQCPEIVLGRYVAITAFAGSPLTPTQGERALGWRQDGRVAWSPKVLPPSFPPYEGSDEWYVFHSPASFEPREIFVNLGKFGLHDPDYLLENREPTWDRGLLVAEIERNQGIQERFWSQLALIQPESYLADGYELIFATSNQELFTHAVASIKS